MFGRIFRGRSRQQHVPVHRLPGPYAPLLDEPARAAPAEIRQAHAEPLEQPTPPETIEEQAAPLGPAIAEADPPVQEPPVVERFVAAAEAADPIAEVSERPPALPISAAERAVIVDVMRVAPDVRYRAARSLDLLGGLEATHGVGREHALLERARGSGKLIALAEAIAR